VTWGRGKLFYGRKGERERIVVLSLSKPFFKASEFGLAKTSKAFF